MIVDASSRACLEWRPGAIGERRRGAGGAAVRGKSDTFDGEQPRFTEKRPTGHPRMHRILRP